MTEIATTIPNDLVASTEHLELNNSVDNDSDSENQHQNGQNNSSAENNGKGERVGSIHFLENEWSFWYDKRPAPGKRIRGEQESYESNLREIGAFGSVEDFWRYYNHMMKPSKIDNNSNYHFFKKGIKPMWEDSHNLKGGKWVITIKGNDKGLVDSVWENVVLSLIGETLDSEDEICGAVFSKRKAGDRIAVWNRNRDNEMAIMHIGRQMKAMLGSDFAKVSPSYQNHEDSLKSGASYSNPSRYNI